MERIDRSQGAPSSAREESPQGQRGVVAGLLLCGGRSARMGSDKALERVGDRSLMDYPLAALREVAEVILLACGAVPRYKELGLELALDGMADGGPLAGLAAGLEAARERRAEWVAVLACDMPFAEGRSLRALIERARAEQLDLCLLELERGTQPTFAVYHVRCAEAARAALAAGERRMVSFHSGHVGGRALRAGSLKAADIGASGESARNVNTPAELERARATLASEARR